MYQLSFIHKNKKNEFKSSTFRGVYTSAINWLYTNGYKFDENVRGRELIKRQDVPKNYIGHGVYSLPNSDYAILVNFGIDQSIRYLKIMLGRFGATNILIEKDKSDDIKKFSEIDNEESGEEEVTFYENPFKQSICVLGESGTGKSVTVENVLEYEEHEYEFIIPTAATTGLLSQFSPSKSGYVPSRLGNMILAAAKNPETCYTAVFDEMHKSNVIEMINDELLQCISTKRNNGNRFISLDEDTAELYNIPELEKKRGNIYLPDNFGFIFISSKPRVISNNPDFFNRVDIVVLNSYEEETIETAEELLSKVLDEDEKNELKTTRND